LTPFFTVDCLLRHSIRMSFGYPADYDGIVQSL
jgi:hypothetical protein